MRNPKPAWGMLYALLPLALALLVTAHLTTPSDGWRQVAEGVVSLLIMGATALWVRMNRLGLALLGRAPESREPLRAWVAYCPPATPRRRVEIPGDEHIQELAA